MEIQYWTLNICCFQETQPSQAGEILRSVFKEIPYIHSDWIYNQWLLTELPEESWKKTWTLPALRNVLWCLWRHGLLGEPPIHTSGLGKERKPTPAPVSSNGAIGRDSKESIFTYIALAKKTHLSFSIRCYKKPQMNFLTNQYFVHLLKHMTLLW